MTPNTRYILAWFKAPLYLIALVGLVVADVCLSAWEWMNKR
jgi:hypothetical protein